MSAASVELTSINFSRSSSSLFGFKTKGSYGSAESNRYDIARGTLSGRSVALRGGGDFIDFVCAADSRPR